MARNRKRRSDRRPPLPGDDATPPGVATANGGHHAEAPDPIEHATPDVELAEAQLALGRPELAVPADESFDDEDAGFEAGDEVEDANAGGGSRGLDGGGGRRGLGGGGAGGADAGGALTPSPSSVPATHGLGPIPRLVAFLQGSWRELQRVQWPDRRQVMQATGVVIGFVIVAGVFLGVADFVAGKVVTFILK